MTVLQPDTEVRQASTAPARSAHEARTTADGRAPAAHPAATSTAPFQTVCQQLRDVSLNLTHAMAAATVAETALRGQRVDADVAIANILQRHVGHPLYVEIERLQTLLIGLGERGAQT